MSQKCKFIYAVLSITGGPAFVHGFHMGLTNILIQRILEWYVDIRKEERELSLDGFYNEVIMGSFLSAAFALGAIVGSLCVLLANLLGRKGTLLVINGIILVALLLMSFAYLASSYEAFIIGRFMMGICGGIGSGVAPMYLIEISPCCLRGTVGSFYHVMVALSALYAYINGMESLLGGEDDWPYIFICCIPPACIHVLMLLFVPESPKYLYFNQDDEDEATEAVAWFQGPHIDHEIEDMREEAEVLAEIGPANPVTMLTQQVLRSPFIITTVILLTQQICGIDSVLYFSVLIFGKLGYQELVPRDLAIGLASVNVAGAIISMILIDRVGRRLLLLASLGGMMLSSSCFTLIILLMQFTAKPLEAANGVAVFFLYLYVMTFAIGCGTIPWFYVSELNSHYARPWAASIGLFLNWITHFAVVMTFMLVWSEIGHFVFLIFIAMDLIAIVFIFFTMRETMDVENSDIAEMFFE